MSESKCVHHSSKNNLAGQRLSRRLFVQNMTVFSAAALAGSSLLGSKPALAAQPTPTAPPTVTSTLTPTPATADSVTVAEALKNRKSTNDFQAQALPQGKLLDLLGAAWGINRPDSGKRTAPSAMNTQEIDIYVLAADGTYVYDAKQNQLTLVSDQDLRAKSGAMKFKDAPVQLVFVADYAKYRAGERSQQELWSAAHTGFIGQNVYLYCAAEGLSAHFFAGLDAAALKDSLQLWADQAVVFGQAVGYPKE
jgi:nitroreductase